MKLVLVLSFIWLVFISPFWCRNLIVGTSYNGKLAWQQKADYNAFPFIKRVKDYFYANPSQLLIKAIVLRDLENSDSSATITAGGVGSSYANIRLKSKRGGNLNYQMEIYV